MSALVPNTSRTAADSALAPSRTTSSPSSKARPRSTRSASRAQTTVLFSVEPSQSPTGFRPPAPRFCRSTEGAFAEFEVDDAEPFMTGCDQRRDLDIAYIAGKLGVARRIVIASPLVG